MTKPETSLISSSLEDYLEAILLLIREHGAARAGDIAEHLQVRRSSVTGALRALNARGFVNYEPYGEITLTEAGLQTAEKVLRRHLVLRDFFTKVLAIDQAEAEEAACQMEHGVSKQITQRLDKFMQFIELCPRIEKDWRNKNLTPPPVTEDCVECMQGLLDGFKKQLESE